MIRSLYSEDDDEFDTKIVFTKIRATSCWFQECEGLCSSNLGSVNIDLTSRLQFEPRFDGSTSFTHCCKRVYRALGHCAENRYPTGEETFANRIPYLPFSGSENIVESPPYLPSCLSLSPTLGRPLPTLH